MFMDTETTPSFDQNFLDSLGQDFKDVLSILQKNDRFDQIIEKLRRGEQPNDDESSSLLDVLRTSGHDALATKVEKKLANLEASFKESENDQQQKGLLYHLVGNTPKKD